MASEIIYHPDNVGTKVLNSRGRKVVVRKYHLTDEEMRTLKEKWLSSLSTIEKKRVSKAGKGFFNPFRRGIYYYQVQALFLLGPNEWHSLPKILSKIEEIMSKIPSRKKLLTNAWEEFRGKTEREQAHRCKDYVGRIQENFILFQRLSQLHPYGYKLRQVGAAIDIKRVTKAGMPNGAYYYRLHTYKDTEKAWPIRDFRWFSFPLHERRFVSSKFMGTIITKDKEVFHGVEV